MIMCIIINCIVLKLILVFFIPFYLEDYLQQNDSPVIGFDEETKKISSNIDKKTPLRNNI